MIALALLAIGCNSADRYEGAFDLPHARAVLHEDAGPFDETVAYVGDLYDGQISILALKQGRFLTDHSAASFARGEPLAAGRERVIADMASWSPDGERVYVFAADQAFGHLIRLTHVAELDSQGTPVRAEFTSVGPDGGGSASMNDLVFRRGYTTTEQWSVTYDAFDDAWWVEGSRSGRLAEKAIAGEPYVGPRGLIAFTIDGQGSADAPFTMSTDSGLVEYDLGGRPTQLAMAPDQSRLAVAVRDSNASQTTLHWFDPATEEFTDIALPVDAQPGRMEFAGDTLFVADSGRPAAWEIRADDTLIEHVLPWTISDVAVLPDESGTGGTLYVASTDGRTVWQLDLLTDEFIDVNPSAPGVQGQFFDAPVQGITAIPLAHDWIETDQEGTRLNGRTVAISLQTARVLFMEEGTGCLTTDAIGPTTDPTSTGGGTVDYTTTIRDFKLDGRFPFLVANESNTRHVQVNPCGGVARSENWLLTYRRNLQAWTVEGSTSGLQEGLVYEDQRYTSDAGEFSLTIRSGGFPSEEGWNIEFRINQGTVIADGVDDLDPGNTIQMTLPGDPLYFHYMAGVEGEQTDRPYLLVVAEGADLTTRINPGNGLAEVEWW